MAVGAMDHGDLGNRWLKPQTFLKEYSAQTRRWRTGHRGIANPRKKETKLVVYDLSLQFNMHFLHSHPVAVKGAKRELCDTSTKMSTCSAR